MNLIFNTLKKILFWCYERGTWQYDLMCVLILAFIFLMPNWVFNTTGRSTPDHAVATREVIKETVQPASLEDSNKQKEQKGEKPESPADKR